MLELLLHRDTDAALKILCLGAHSDDIEIGCGGTVLHLTRRYRRASVDWVVFSSDSDRRRQEALAGADAFLAAASTHTVAIEDFRDGFFPAAFAALKQAFETLRARVTPDVIFTHYRHDLHQDHKMISDLTWQTFRNALLLEYEIPKWDGDLGSPNCYMPLPDDLAEQKIRCLCDTFQSQSAKQWFTAETFRGLMRLRGVESQTRFAEAFYARKLTIG